MKSYYAAGITPNGLVLLTWREATADEFSQHMKLVKPGESFDGRSFDEWSAVARGPGFVVDEAQKREPK